MNLIGEPVHCIRQVVRHLRSCQCHEDGRERCIGVVLKTVGIHQVVRHFRPELGIHLPEIGCLSTAHHVGVGDVKDIAQAPAGPAVIDEGDPLRATVDPASHPVVPGLKFHTGSGVRPLGVDQHGVRKVVAVELCRCVQVAGPCADGPGDFGCMGLCQRPDVVVTCHLLLHIKRAPPAKCR
ncbi:MAG: hypothetical protein IJH81_01325 [Lachnospiraceae bacterium]|nr:hypothetical protein [Lachnospiraceae bacterium]